MKMGVFRVVKVRAGWRVVGVCPKKSCDWERGGMSGRGWREWRNWRSSVVLAEFVSDGDRQLRRTDKILPIRSENTPYDRNIFTKSPFFST